MNYWIYTPSKYFDSVREGLQLKSFNERLRTLIDSTPRGIQSQKQPVSHYDGYNHAKSEHKQTNHGYSHVYNHVVT